MMPTARTKYNQPSVSVWGSGSGSRTSCKSDIADLLRGHSPNAKLARFPTAQGLFVAFTKFLLPSGWGRLEAAPGVHPEGVRRIAVNISKRRELVRNRPNKHPGAQSPGLSQVVMS